MLFSDPNANTIYKYMPNGNEEGKLEVFRTPSGYSGADIAEYGQPGSNGLTLDPQGRLTINQHGNRRVVRDEKDGTQTVLADSYEGKRLNSPNDLVYRSDGTLFFTDPPFGFPKAFEDARKQLPFSGVFSIYKGKLQLVSKDFTGPNGIAFSPDEKYLYVGNWPRALTGQHPRAGDDPVGEPFTLFRTSQKLGASGEFETELSGNRDLRSLVPLPFSGAKWIILLWAPRLPDRWESPN